MSNAETLPRSPSSAFRNLGFWAQAKPVVLHRGSAAPGTPLARLKLAVLLRVAVAYKNRDKIGGGDGEHRPILPLRILGT